MFFLSHNYKDKNVVERVALALREVYGQNKVFYDSWSIQPGEGIVDKMGEGMTECEFFLFFVSKNSLDSPMVKLEWQNMIMRSAKFAPTIKFIPIKLDETAMPVLLTQTLYIDLYTNGIEIAIRQMIDVIDGRNTYRPPVGSFSNIIAYMYKDGGKVVLECHAEYYVEHNSSFMFCTQSDVSKIKINIKNESIYSKHIVNNQRLTDGYMTNCVFITIPRTISPGFPLIIEFTTIDNSLFDIERVLHEKIKGGFKSIPMKIGEK